MTLDRTVALAPARRSSRWWCGRAAGTCPSSFSCAEILIALFYGGVLRYRPGAAADPARDRLIVSKGHAAMALYPILADVGFLPAGALERLHPAGGPPPHVRRPEHPRHRRDLRLARARARHRGRVRPCGPPRRQRPPRLRRPRRRRVHRRAPSGSRRSGRRTRGSRTWWRSSTGTACVILGETETLCRARRPRSQVAELRLGGGHRRRPRRPEPARRRLRPHRTHRGPAARDRRRHGEGEGHLVHGGPPRVAQPDAERGRGGDGAARAGARSVRGGVDGKEPAHARRGGGRGLRGRARAIGTSSSCRPTSAPRRSTASGRSCRGSSSIPVSPSST